jgi:hypothetical protein
MKTVSVKDFPRVFAASATAVARRSRVADVAASSAILGSCAQRIVKGAVKNPAKELVRIKLCRLAS